MPLCLLVERVRPTEGTQCAAIVCLWLLILSVAAVHVTIWQANPRASLSKISVRQGWLLGSTHLFSALETESLPDQIALPRINTRL